ncbi:hypothetical protein AcV7_005591 [Taiwanofungus camphoratus]|nr:hypothetical protein AcV7_005591 [Antrodia cinnamomea]
MSQFPSALPAVAGPSRPLWNYQYGRPYVPSQLGYSQQSLDGHYSTLGAVPQPALPVAGPRTAYSWPRADHEPGPSSSSAGSTGRIAIPSLLFTTPLVQQFSHPLPDVAENNGDIPTWMTGLPQEQVVHNQEATSLNVSEPMPVSSGPSNVLRSMYLPRDGNVSQFHEDTLHTLDPGSSTILQRAIYIQNLMASHSHGHVQQDLGTTFADEPEPVPSPVIDEPSPIAPSVVPAHITDHDIAGSVDAFTRSPSLTITEPAHHIAPSQLPQAHPANAPSPPQPGPVAQPRGAWAQMMLKQAMPACASFSRKRPAQIPVVLPPQSSSSVAELPAKRGRKRGASQAELATQGEEQSNRPIKRKRTPRTQGKPSEAGATKEKDNSAAKSRGKGKSKSKSMDKGKSKEGELADDQPIKARAGSKGKSKETSSPGSTVVQAGNKGKGKSKETVPSASPRSTGVQARGKGKAREVPLNNASTSTSIPLPIIASASSAILDITSPAIISPTTTAVGLSGRAINGAIVPLPVVASSGPIIASSGPIIASSGPVIASSGPVIASSGPVIASSGPIVSSSNFLDEELFGNSLNT